GQGARLAQVAAVLGLSPRALQRRLTATGTTFQQVLDDVRHGLATFHLRQGGMSLGDLAYALGYQDQSAFNHAFRDWTGTNPGAWREAQQAQQAR
ncbi:MAG TPA: helix-turn-helix transcriptional regulator, partial [Burkholderiaceae bacterium]